MAAILLLIPSTSEEYGRLHAHPVPGLELCDPATPDYPADPGAYLPPRLALQWAEQAQAARILIGDLRCAAALRALREAGWHAERIGHRRFGGDSGSADQDSSPGLTTWEQITAAGRVALTPEEQGREAWQRDGWWGCLPWAWDGKRRTRSRGRHSSSRNSNGPNPGRACSATLVGNSMT